MLAWLTTNATSLGILWSLIVVGGGTSLFAQVGRDLGRRKQEDLFRQWGGPPTTQMLRLSGNPTTELIKRRRNKLGNIINCLLPTKEEERADPVAADERYGSAVAYLLEATRDHEKFPLVLEENINYGFRRNLWGMKPYGLTIVGLATAATWGLFLFELLENGADASWYERLLGTSDPDLIVRLLGAVLNTGLLAGWTLVVRPRWIKTAADTYASRLFAAVDSL